MVKKYFVGLVAILMLAVAVPAMAQDKAKGKRGGQKQGRAKAGQRAQVLPQRLLEGLELTDEQKTKLAAIEKEMKAPIMAARKTVNDLLTDEQKQIRKTTTAKAKEEGKKLREIQKAVEEALKLTEEQQAKMAKAKAKVAEVQKQIRDKVLEILTPEQRKAVEEKMKKARGQRAKPGDGAKKPRGGRKGAKAKKPEAEK